MANRTIKSSRNIAFGFGAELIRYFLMFITRTVFIRTLNTAYLGVNGLFSDILTMLSLAELGVGNALLFSMYKPYANHENEKVAALLNTYKMLYNIIGFVVTIAGLLLMPNLSFFITDIPEIENLNTIYILYLLNTSLSYFFVYKRSILIVDQEAYIISVIKTISVIIQSVLQIILLLAFHDFILYLAIQIICTVGNNICISFYVDRKYPYLKQYNQKKIDTETKGQIKRNICGVFISKISSVIVTSTDNLLISKFVSTMLLGVYSNYVIFVDLFKAIINKIFESIMGSVGNMVAIENKERTYALYKKIYFLNTWIVSYCCAMLFLLVNQFVVIWIGEAYLLSYDVIFFICLNLYMRLVRCPNSTFIDTYGLFWNVKWKAIAEALINVVASLFLLIVMDMGVSGVLLGTFISNIVTNFWFEPYILYRSRFKQPVVHYFKHFLIYFCCILCGTMISYGVNYSILITSNELRFVVCAIIDSFLINAIFVALFRKTEEYKYAKGICNKVLKKIVRNKMS